MKDIQSQIISMHAILIFKYHSPIKLIHLKYYATQVTFAIFDRSISKLVKAVVHPTNSIETKRDALKTLNEISSHQVLIHSGN